MARVAEYTALTNARLDRSHLPDDLLPPQVPRTLALHRGDAGALGLTARPPGWPRAFSSGRPACGHDRKGERREAAEAASRRVFYPVTGMLEMLEVHLLLRKARNLAPGYLPEIGRTRATAGAG
jgi:hypothetical protein